MAEKKAGKAKKAKARRERTERRFEPEQTQTNNLAVIGGMAGNRAAIGAVRVANAVSMIFCGAPSTPVMPPTAADTTPAAPCSAGGAFMNGAAVALTTSISMPIRPRVVMVASIMVECGSFSMFVS